tara:strand:- start:117 stop:1586 length:1470 start_codon:yes stop_codon:yes gene_type:complete
MGKIKKYIPEFPIIDSREEALSLFWSRFNNPLRNKKGKIIKAPRFFTLKDSGQQVMIDVNPVSTNPGKLTIDDFTVRNYTSTDLGQGQAVAAQETRQKKLPNEVKVYIINTYGEETLKNYQQYLTGKRNREKAIKAELLTELKRSLIDLDKSYHSPESPQEGIHRSHFSAVKGDLQINPTYEAKNWKFRQPSALFDRNLNNPLMIRNPKPSSALWNHPDADQTFLEFAKANIFRDNRQAVDKDELRRLGIPTNYLESIANFLIEVDDARGALQDSLVREQLTNKDLATLVRGGTNADQLISKRTDSYFDDKYGTHPLDVLIERIRSNPNLTEDAKNDKIERLTDQFTHGELTRGMFQEEDTVGDIVDWDKLTESGKVKEIRRKYSTDRNRMNYNEPLNRLRRSATDALGDLAPNIPIVGELNELTGGVIGSAFDVDPITGDIGIIGSGEPGPGRVKYSDYSDYKEILDEEFDPNNSYFKNNRIPPRSDI